MASTYTELGLQLMATGENAGSWGTKTNTNLSAIEQITGGYLEVSIAGGAGNTPLDVVDGNTTGKAQNRIIKLTGSISGNQTVTLPVGMENFYIIQNATTGAYTVELEAVSGSGATVTWATTDKGWKIIYADGVATNTGIYDTGFSTAAGDVTLTGTQTLTNKTLTAPKIGTSILDTNGNELFLLTATASAVNELTYANAATGNNPAFTATGGDTNIGLNLVPKGTGVLQGAGSALKIAGLETMWVPASAMYGATTNGADAQQVETTATRPDMKVLDFDASTPEYAQFSVAFPKSWNEGTVTYQVFWTPSTTNTGNCTFQLQGVAVGDGDTIDIAYGTGITVTDAAIGTVEDQQVSPVSSAVTIAGSPAVDQQTYFNFLRSADTGADTFTGDARVLGIKIFFTTDAANDA
jgi:hypothetical protein